MGVVTRVGRSLHNANYVLAVAFFTLPVVLSAPTAHAGYASFVMDAQTGEVFHARNANTRNFPASLTKIMTLFMVFDAIDKGDLRLDQQLPVSKRAAGQAPSKLGLRAGQKITVEAAIRALSVKSANDVATVVAEAIGGTEIQFAQMMTRRARSLGMRRTTFKNASGLPNRGQLSTARDMATLGKAMLDLFPEHYTYFSDLTFRYGQRTYRNHNKLLKTYDGMDGIKTGYIRASGFNLVASAERDGVRLIGVVFGGKTGKSRDAHMSSLLNRSWARARKNSTFAALPASKPSFLKKAPASSATYLAPAPTTTTRLNSPANLVYWGVQVGAFKRFRRAHKVAGEVVLKLQGLPAKATIEILPLESQGKKLFRARIVGMKRDVARNVCRQLRSFGSQCAMVTPSGSIQMAQVLR
ncbi:MAG: D-alanyl-D-alanine carboxypeptidase [Alphaproteobacteria bacterium]|nr:D-alanyl-D-alanine carboxypeptidase [Alphaproteobacteria bacterium]HCP00029.1 D-alanyl-D-alanine carboxypeptidase [Rhodospirillaceae bacterium]